MSGFVAMQREALDHPLLRDANSFGAWFKLLSMAAFEPVQVRLDGAQRELSGGQIYGTVIGFARALGWNELSVHCYFARLEKHRMIAREPIGGGWIVTILDRSTFSPANSSGNGLGIIPFLHWSNGRPLPIYGRGRAAIPSKVQRAVRERDGDQCRYCRSTEGPFELDHITPHSRGGPDTVENLVVACRDCNSRKSDHSLEELGWSL